MTTAHEAKARSIVRSGFDCADVKMRDGEMLVSAIAEALREAEERATDEEREACASMLEGVANRIDSIDAFTELAKKNLNSAVAAIRARALIRGRNSTDASPDF